MSQKRISPLFDDVTYEQIKNIAHKENKSMSEVVRNWTIERLNGEINAENIDLITTIIREQLNVILQPHTERLAALSAKTCIQASAAAYLTAETISRFLNNEQQEEFQEIYEKARKKGVAYTKNKSSENEM